MVESQVNVSEAPNEENVDFKGLGWRYEERWGYLGCK